MDRLKIDFLRTKYALDTPKRSGGFFLGRFLMITLVVTALFGVSFSYHITSGEEGSGGAVGLFSSLARLVGSGERSLEGAKDDRINLLLLGVGGQGHDGPELSDTIIFTSFRPSTKQVGMLSIPRDLAVPIPGYDWRKINHANAFGEIQEEGSGPELASAVVTDVLDQDIHYYVKVNFDGFIELIDELGGIDVYVDRAFTDYQYPTDDFYTQVVSFEEGWQRMDGETALIFARSRHGNNGEAGDFSRAARQQKILLAIKDKVLSSDTLLNPTKVGKVIDTLSGNINTNLTVWEIMTLTSYAPDVDQENITHHVLSDAVDGPLYASNINGAYVLLPKNDDWSRVERIAANVFAGEGSQELAAPADEETPHFVRVEVQNGTSIGGLAFETSQLLESQGFDVAKIGNAAERGYTHTVIYDLTEGTKSEELAVLQDLLSGDVSMSAAGWIYTNDVIPTELTVTDDPGEQMATEDDLDFLVILGENTAELVLR